MNNQSTLIARGSPGHVPSVALCMAMLSRCQYIILKTVYVQLVKRVSSASKLRRTVLYGIQYYCMHGTIDRRTVQLLYNHDRMN
jgi:hypothetical protein